MTYRIARNKTNQLGSVKASRQTSNTPAPVIEGDLTSFNHVYGENEPRTYWYHPDHLGSSSYITNVEGIVTQHMEYMPYGESLVEEHQNSINTPYKFNGKELDDETGNYYYGARYYNPKFSFWLSVDPLAEKFYDLSPYAYVSNNPINLIDPTGMSEERADDWIIKNGNPFFDECINSQKEFDESNYDKSIYSYGGKEMQLAVSMGSTAGLMINHYDTSGNINSYEFPAWLTVGMSHMGLTEGKNNTIQGMIDKHNSEYARPNGDVAIANDSQPWCGVFVYSCLSESGVPMTSNSWQLPSLNTFYKNNWKDGKTISEPKIGAIAVMKYSHVAMVIGFDANTVSILGGNQPRSGPGRRDGVEVNISTYPRSQVSAYILPTGYNPAPLGKF